MTNRIRAIYERGVFRPIEPVALKDGSRVELEFEMPTPPPGAKDLAAALAEIAALPVEGPHDRFSGADHERILYGGDDAR
jgi:predicted DNA-binding antitoxin AbrB/MazE fold protein